MMRCESLSLRRLARPSAPVLLAAFALISLSGCETDGPTAPCADDQPDDIFVISDEYLNNRFFKLDLPEYDLPGRDPATQFIDPNSIQVYEAMDAGEFGPDDIPNVAVYRDTTGIWTSEGDHLVETVHSVRWRLCELELRLNVDGHVVGVDLKQSYDPSSTLAVVYDVVGYSAHPGGTLYYSVGDRPGRDDADRIDIEGDLYYRMKLLKAADATDTYTYRYVMRNIYALGATNIDPATLELALERHVQADVTPELDENLIPYLRIFGLDRTDPLGGDPDGLADIANPLLFDLQRGLLTFPLDFPEPFAGTNLQYTEYAGTADVVSAPDDGNPNAPYGTFLYHHKAPQLYDPEHASQLEQFGYFRFRISHAEPSEPDP